MLNLVIYDISDTHDRNLIIKTLRHFGLHRIQKSAFLGELSAENRKELEDDFESFFLGPKDSIIIIPICDKCKDLTHIFAQGELELENPHNFKIV